MAFADQLATSFVPISASYSDAEISQALKWAQSFVEEYCNRGDGGFDLIQNDIAFVDPLVYRQALLPSIPVAGVSAVSALMPSPLTGVLGWTTLTNYAFVSETGLLYDTTGQPGVPWTFGPSWPTLPGSLQVTYSHGYSQIPNGLINAACRFTQQYLENPALLLQREVGDFHERYAGNSGGVGIVINAFDERILERYTLVTIA